VAGDGHMTTCHICVLW